MPNPKSPKSPQRPPKRPSSRPPSNKPRRASGWDPLASWYDGWVGAEGSDHHRKLAIPTVLELLDLREGEKLLDVGSGQGVLAPYAARDGVSYTGVEISPRLLEIAQKRHKGAGRFFLGDARQLRDIDGLKPASFDAVVFLLSIQDMNPLEEILPASASMLRDGGRMVLLMTHPAFRIPRQSGWGHDQQRDLRFRRIDTYLTPLAVPMKQYSDVNRGNRGNRAPQKNAPRRNETPRDDRQGVSISFHRPLSQYVNVLAACGMLIDAMREVPSEPENASPQESRANAEIPLFLGIRARKLG